MDGADADEEEMAAMMQMMIAGGGPGGGRLPPGVTEEELMAMLSAASFAGSRATGMEATSQEATTRRMMALEASGAREPYPWTVEPPTSASAASSSARAIPYSATGTTGGAAGSLPEGPFL